MLLPGSPMIHTNRGPMSATLRANSRRSRSSSPASTYSLEDRINDQNVRPRSHLLLKAKRVRFYRNGDRFYKGVVVAVTPERYRSFDSLVCDLTRALVDNVNLPSGVRLVFTMEGRKVSCLEDLEDGKSYVCSGVGETFKRIDYGTVNLAQQHRRSVSAMNPVSPRIHLEYVTPRLITIVRNGTHPRRVVRLLLNKRNAPSLDSAFSAITEAVKLDTGAVRKVFTQSGSQIAHLEDFFGLHHIFFAYGTERYSREDFDLDNEECKAVEAQSKGPALFRRFPWRSGDSRSPRSGLNSMKPSMPTKTGARQSESPTTSLPPQLNIRYEIGRVIGDGNFAVVRACVNRSTGVRYALKIIDKCKCRGKEHMIESEVAILRRVRHPNIVRLYHEQDSPTELYLVMELVEGGDLFDAISVAGTFPEAVASVMTRNVASALFYLHSRMIVHRDIKPENLLVCVDSAGNKTLKLGDFGLAQKVTQQRPLYTVCGTPTYVAPEILAEAGYGLKIDVWAAGVILYILLCGYPPFVSGVNDQEELFDQILSGRYEFNAPYWDSVSLPAKDLVQHLLQVDPEHRFTAEDMLDHSWLQESGGVEPLRVLRHSTTLSSPNLPALCSEAVSG